MRLISTTVKNKILKGNRGSFSRYLDTRWRERSINKMHVLGCTNAQPNAQVLCGRSDVVNVTKKRATKHSSSSRNSCSTWSVSTQSLCMCIHFLCGSISIYSLQREKRHKSETSFTWGKKKLELVYYTRLNTNSGNNRKMRKLYKRIFMLWHDWNRNLTVFSVTYFASFSSIGNQSSVTMNNSNEQLYVGRLDEQWTRKKTSRSCVKASLSFWRV